MIVYHGSNVVVENPKIIPSEIGRDFGVGFYTTDIIDQAIRWSKRKAALSSCPNSKAKAILNKYELNERAFEKLSYKSFDNPDKEWLDLVCKCRTQSDYIHGFDLVAGKIANDNVGETVEYVLRGIMRPEDAIEKLKFEKINNQICFCTEKSLSYLDFVGYDEV